MTDMTAIAAQPRSGSRFSRHKHRWTGAGDASADRAGDAALKTKINLVWDPGRKAPDPLPCPLY
jgi:hypothetical protein